MSLTRSLGNSVFRPRKTRTALECWGGPARIIKAYHSLEDVDLIEHFLHLFLLQQLFIDDFHGSQGLCLLVLALADLSECA